MNRAALKPLLLSLAVWGCVASSLASGAVPEYDVKAALIYKIGKFVHWPDGAFGKTGGDALHLCLLGHDDFGASIDALQGLRIEGHGIVIERRHDASAAASCQILFISRSERAHLGEILAAVGTAPALTVSDIEGFALEGGMVNLVVTAGKVGFQINPTAASHAGLEIGAQLLQLATLVGDRKDGKP